MKCASFVLLLYQFKVLWIFFWIKWSCEYEKYVWRELLVAQLGLKIDDHVFLLFRKHSTLQSGTQVVDPTQAAALAVSL
jgi:hypothetical protein